MSKVAVIAGAVVAAVAGMAVVLTLAFWIWRRKRFRRAAGNAESQLTDLLAVSEPYSPPMQAGSAGKFYVSLAITALHIF